MRNALMLGAAALVLVATGLWLFAKGSQSDRGAVQGVVLVNTSAPVAGATPSSTPPSATLPAQPDKVVAEVRKAYPLLTRVDFGCDAEGCAVTATIPPPTGEAFLATRQEMLLGGLAKVAAAEGYRATGPVQMEEDKAETNRFHIRLPVDRAR